MKERIVMHKRIVYIHGMGGSAAEAMHYKNLFRDCDVIGLDYTAKTPWEAEQEFPKLFRQAAEGNEHVELIAVSIGAWFAMHALNGQKIERAFFISPVADMEQLIHGMMLQAGISEDELCEKEEIRTSAGEILSWRYLTYAKEHSVDWHIPTDILYGENDQLTSIETISDFAERFHASLTVMENGEHWFHTEEEMRFLDEWIIRSSQKQN